MNSERDEREAIELRATQSRGQEIDHVAWAEAEARQERTQLLESIAAQARDRDLTRPVPSFLTYMIRWALDVSLPLDLLAIEKLADHTGMQALAHLRTIAVIDRLIWCDLRNNAPTLWRILLAERRAMGQLA